MTSTFLVVSLMLVRIEGPHAMAERPSRAMVERVKRKLLRNRIRIRSRGMKTIPDPEPTLNTKDDEYGRFLVLREKIKTRQGVTTHVLLPPIEGTWLHGRAVQSSYWRGGFSTSNAKQDKPFASATALAHELLHTIGATHKDGTNLMNADALPISERTRKIPRILNSTRREVESYLLSSRDGGKEYD